MKGKNEIWKSFICPKDFWCNLVRFHRNLCQFSGRFEKVLFKISTSFEIDLNYEYTNWIIFMFVSKYHKFFNFINRINCELQTKFQKHADSFPSLNTLKLPPKPLKIEKRSLVWLQPGFQS